MNHYAITLITKAGRFVFNTVAPNRGAAVRAVLGGEQLPNGFAIICKVTQ